MVHLGSNVILDIYLMECVGVVLLWGCWKLIVDK